MIAYEIFNLHIVSQHFPQTHIFSNNDRNVTTIKITSNKNLLNVNGWAFIKVRETKKILRHDRPQRTVYLLYACTKLTQKYWIKQTRKACQYTSLHVHVSHSTLCVGGSSKQIKQNYFDYRAQCISKRVDNSNIHYIYAVYPYTNMQLFYYIENIELN